MTASPDTSRAPAAHLSSDQLRRLRALLDEERATRRALVEEFEADAVDARGQRDGDSTVEREVADSALERARVALAEVDAALARMDDGTYGVCEDCGAPIPFERLEAIPETRTCVACPGRRMSLL